MEATGIYHENCACFLYEKGFNVSIILPNKAKKYLDALGLKSKNDSIDAKGLSQMGAEQCLELWQPMGTFFYELRLLTRQHQNTTELKTVLKNQLDALTYAMHQLDSVTNQLKQTIVLFETQIKELEKEMQKHLKSNEEVYNKVKNIEQVKGLGILTIATILAETNGFTLFKNYKQVVSYAGYDVVEAQSGKRVGKTKISKRGNSRIRRALHMPSLVVIQCKVKPFKDLYDRTYEKHGVKMKSYVAVQKKLLTMIYHLWNKNEAYDINYQTKIQEEEQKFSLGQLASKKTQSQKNSPNIKIEATQGKHPVNYRKKLPLGVTNV
jgi:transposase